MAQVPLTLEARTTAQALAQLIETALAVDGDAWIAAIDDAKTHRPIDRALDALAQLVGESPARWQGGLGYWPTDGGRGLLARAYDAIRVSAIPCPTCGDTSCDGRAVRELRGQPSRDAEGSTPAVAPAMVASFPDGQLIANPERLTPATLPIERIEAPGDPAPASTSVTPTVFIWKDTPEPTADELLTPDDDDAPW